MISMPCGMGICGGGWGAWMQGIYNVDAEEHLLLYTVCPVHSIILLHQIYILKHIVANIIWVPERDVPPFKTPLILYLHVLACAMFHLRTVINFDLRKL